MSRQTQKLRRSGAKIMASLIVLSGQSLSYIMILAVINGSRWVYLRRWA